jgi:PAP2 superfamily protein
MRNTLSKATHRLGISTAGTRLAPGFVAACLALALTSRADMVTDWNLNLEKAAKVAAQLPPVESRTAAIVQTAVFDAVNGIAGKYEPYLVAERGPRGARADAAAAQAAYTALKALYPAQAGTFDAELADSLASLPGHRGRSQAIARGRAWGEHVANLILAARSLDGFSATVPGFFGGTAPGVWRSLPAGTNADGTLPAVLPQFRFVVPFALIRANQFRPGPPPALTSTEYAADVNEVKAIGRVDSTTRTADQTKLAQLWQAVSIVDLFRGVREGVDPGASLVENARLFALLGIVSCDALIAIFDAKYTYNFWRPYHAIRLADTDGNPLTEADPTWTALVFAPRHQEYPSAHCIATGGFMRVLSRELGDEHPFRLSSPGFPSFTWTFDRFSDAAAQVKGARVWAGIHYPNSCNVGGAMGVAVGDYVVDNVLLPLGEGEDGHGQRGESERD